MSRSAGSGSCGDPTVTIDLTGIDGEPRPRAAPFGQTTGGGLPLPLLPVGSASARLSSSRGLLATATAGRMDVGSRAARNGRRRRRNRPQGAPAASRGGAISLAAGSDSRGVDGAAALLVTTSASTTGGSECERGREQAGRTRCGASDRRRVPGGSPPGASGAVSLTAGATPGDRGLVPAAPASSASMAGGVSLLTSSNDAGAGGVETAPAVARESRPGHSNSPPSNEGRSTGSGDVSVGTANAAAHGVSLLHHGTGLPNGGAAGGWFGLTRPAVGSGGMAVGALVTVGEVAAAAGGEGGVTLPAVAGRRAAGDRDGVAVGPRGAGQGGNCGALASTPAEGVAVGSAGAGGAVAGEGGFGADGVGAGRHARAAGT